MTESLFPNMLIEDLRRRKADIESLARQYGANNIRVFGSVARGEENADSDIDFLVELPRGYDMFRQRLPLTRQLEDITGRRVNLVPEHELNPHLADAIKREAVSI